MPQNSNIRNFITSHLDALVAAIAGFIIVLIYTNYSGIGISPDSIMYMSTARNLNAHAGMNFFGGKPIVLFPVFYPTFLAAAQFITRTDPLPLGPYLDGALFGLLIFLTGVLIDRFTFKSKIYKWLIMIAIVLSPSLLEIYTMLWSETLFMVWMLVFIFAYKNYLNKRTIAALLLLGGVTALACITRYAAITLVGTGGMLLLFDPALELKKKITHILIFGFTGISLLAANLIRNSLVTHTGTGTRYKSLTSLSENMHYFGTVMCDWLTLNPSKYGWAFTVTLLLVLIFIAMYLYHALLKKAKYASYENLAIAFFIVYALFMIISATISRYERINNRLLSPLFIPLLLGATYWIPGLISKYSGKLKIALAALTIGLGCYFIYGEVQRDLQRYDDECDYGIPGYTDDSWNKSEMIHFMKKNPQLFNAGYPVYNNAVEAYYFFTGKGSEYIPKKAEPDSVKKLYSLKRFYIVSFDLLPDTALVPVKTINEHTPLKTIFRNADGGIYLHDETNVIDEKNIIKK